jgi:hypothetical protein
VSFLIELAHPMDDWTDKDVLHMQKDLANAVQYCVWDGPFKHGRFVGNTNLRANDGADILRYHCLEPFPTEILGCKSGKARAGGDLDLGPGPSTSIATRCPPEWRRRAPWTLW